MTHVAEGRNRSRQTNAHPRVLRSLMPGSYGRRGAQASIIGGAPPLPNQQPLYPHLPFPDADQVKLLREETGENKSCLADIEVRLLGFDAMTKILSRHRPGQLIKTIAAFEDLQFAILHTNISTIEQTVLYSFNAKIASETRCTAEDIANSVQQILSFIDANTIR